MSSGTGEKRRMTTRSSRREPPEKKRKLTPEPKKPEPPAERPRSPLPTRLLDGKPLPTVDEPQSNLGADYQSIAASGVLAASLNRSSRRWAAESIFDRYWSRSSYRKRHQAAKEEDEKADKTPGEGGEPQKRDRMLKVGQCSLTIEPHVFNVMLYMIKDKEQPSGTPGQTPTKLAQPGYHPPQQPAYVQPRPQLPPPANANSNTPKASPKNTPSTPAATTQPTPAPLPRHAGTPASTHSSQKAAPDPVIHMLAQRASTDAELKAVMKIVAAGSASEEQLKFFQRHITELTELLDMRNRASARAAAAGGGGTPTSAQAMQQQRQLAQPGTTTAATGSPAAYPNQYNTPTIPRRGPSANVTPAQRFVAPPRPPPTISALLLEFPQYGPDRYALPRHSIIEHLAGGRSALVSFLVVRRGAQAEDPARYDAETEYHQPVTVRFDALPDGDPRVLDALAWFALPQDKVREHMREVMARTKRAEVASLAVRLPKSEGEGEDMEE